MTDVVKRMIDRAIESGSISAQVKQMILAKARKEGDDIDEVEIMLETIPQVDEQITSVGNAGTVRKCPHCGATISGITMTCPECGFTLTSESKSNKEVRNYTLDLQRKIDNIRNRARRSDEDDLYYMVNRNKEVIDAISSFSIPLVQDGLIQCMIYCYSRYESAQQYTEEKAAWLAKSKEFYLFLTSVADNDPSTRAIIDKYAFICVTKAKSEWNLTIKVAGAIFGTLFILFLFLWLVGAFD